MVSESAEFVEHGEHDFWRFRGLRIHGDLSVAVLEAIIDEVTARLGEGEVPDSVWMDAAAGTGRPWEFEMYGDIRLDTCLRRREDGLCSRGNSYVFFRRGGEFVLEKTSMFFAD